MKLIRCKEADLPEIKFRVTDGFSLIIPRRVAKQKTLVAGLGDRLGDGLGDSAQARIVALIQADRTLSITAMSRRLKISTTAVEKTIKRMKLKGILKRIGLVKGGYWQITEQSENKKG